MYALQACWLNAAELSRIDGFYCKCLRRILKVPPSYLSRTPNAVIYSQTGKFPLRYKILQYQLDLFGHVARLPDGDAVRRALMRQGDVRPANFNFKRRGGQINCWIDQVFSRALQVAGDLQRLQGMVFDKAFWKIAVKKFIVENSDRIVAT